MLNPPPQFERGHSRMLLAKERIILHQFYLK